RSHIIIFNITTILSQIWGFVNPVVDQPCRLIHYGVNLLVDHLCRLIHYKVDLVVKDLLFLFSFGF
ncbi:MAG: hypothetical protein KAS07_01240, partial [Candidatus Pacebacteria bacterium]|nr:hypothetical protein [Candidatus Paceibacterota bacterium]